MAATHWPPSRVFIELASVRECRGELDGAACTSSLKRGTLAGPVKGCDTDSDGDAAAAAAAVFIAKASLDASARVAVARPRMPSVGEVAASPGCAYGALRLRRKARNAARACGDGAVVLAGFAAVNAAAVDAAAGENDEDVDPRRGGGARGVRRPPQRASSHSEEEGARRWSPRR